MSEIRDTQRSKVYKAEVILWGKQRQYWKMEDVQEYVAKVTASAWWKKHHRYPTRRIRIGDGRARRKACAIGMDEIRMPVWSRQEEIILHELCHCVINSRFSYRESVASHGCEFAKMLLLMVRHFMGKERYDTLKASYKVHRVHYNTSKV
jgi:putative metallohydrolase (TIGR04338 family)